MKFYKKMSVLIVIGLLVSAFTGSAVASMCIVPPEEGSWENYDEDTRGITSLEFQMECRDVSQTICNNGICSRIYLVEPHYYLRLFGSCTPHDCDWGEVEGVAGTGDLEGWYRFYYNQGFARRYVYARTYPEWPGWLRLYIYTDFTDPGREDYVMDDWFVSP